MNEGRAELIERINANTAGQQELIKQINANTTGLQATNNTVRGLIKSNQDLSTLVGRGMSFEIIKDGQPSGETITKYPGEKLLLHIDGMQAIQDRLQAIEKRLRLNAE